MSLTRKIWLLPAVLGALLLGGIWWLVGTEAGARWALARVMALLPRELAIGQAQGSLLGGLRIRSVDWRGDTLRIAVNDIDLDFELIPLAFRHLNVNELNVGRFEIETSKAADSQDAATLPTIELPIDISITSAHLANVSFRSDSISYAAREIGLSASLFGSDLRVTRLRMVSSRLDLDLHGSVTLAGNYPGRAAVSWRWRQSEEQLFAGELELQGDMRRYDLNNSLTAPVSLSTSGSISIAADKWLAELTNEWQDLAFSIGERRLESPAGSLRLAGSPNDYEVDLDAVTRLDEFPETRMRVTGTVAAQTIQIAQINLINEIGELTASGDASLKPEPVFALEFSLTGLDPSRAVHAVSGALEFAGRVDGRVSEQAPQINLRIERMGGNVNGYPLQGNASIVYARDSLAITDARIRLGSNSSEFKGSIGDSVSLDAVLELTALGEVLPETSGTLRGQVSLRGPRGHPDVRLDLTGAALRWADYSVAELSADATLLRTGRGSAELQLRDISIGETILDSAGISASGEMDSHSVRVSLKGYDSELSIGAEGGYARDLWSGRIASLEITNVAIGRWSSRRESALDVSATGIGVSETCLFPASGPGRACIGGSYRQESIASLDFAMSEIPLSAFPVELPADAHLSGFVDAHVNLERAERRLSGSAGIELRQAMFDATYEGEAISVSFSQAAGQATITDNRVDSTLQLEIADGAGSGNLQLLIQDLANRESPIAGGGNVSINDVSLFGVFLPGITNPRGRIEGGLTVSGTLVRPEFFGGIALTEGAFTVRQAGIEIVDVDLRLSQSAPGRLQLSGRARSGGGRISLQGDTHLSTDSGIRTELILTGENFELSRLPEWQVAASPSIRAVFDERTTVISGALGIPAASITVSELPDTAESASPDAIVHRAEGTEAYRGRRIVVDVTTVFGSEVRFSGFGLTAGVEGAVRLQGGTREPWLGNGSLNLRQGRYKAYGQELEIERGELVFNGPLNEPQLDIRAIRRAADVTAGIQLLGTPSQLRSEVFSEPAMSDAEALSYLLTGRPLSASTFAGEGDALNNAAFALGLSGAGTVASQVRGQLGLETLTVEGGADSGRIVAGKRFGDRLLVEYGYGLIDKLGTLLLRYQLTERVVLESRTGTVSNLDVVYSVKKQ